LIASEILGSVLKNCVEFPNHGKNNNTYEKEMRLLKNMKI